MVSLCLVEDHVIRMHSRYGEGEAELGGNANGVGVSCIVYSIPVCVLGASTVDSKHHLIRMRVERTVEQ